MLVANILVKSDFKENRKLGTTSHHLRTFLHGTSSTFAIIRQILMMGSRTILRLSAGEQLDIQESCCSSLQSVWTWYMYKWIPFPADFSSNYIWLYARNTWKYNFNILPWVWLSWLLITQAHNICELLRDEMIPYTQTLGFPNTKNSL